MRSVVDRNVVTRRTYVCVPANRATSVAIHVILLCHFKSANILANNSKTQTLPTPSPIDQTATTNTNMYIAVTVLAIQRCTRMVECKK